MPQAEREFRIASDLASVDSPARVRLARPPRSRCLEEAAAHDAKACSAS